MNKLADEIGVDKKIYKTALTEVGINFAIYEGMFNQSKDDEQTSIRALALASCEPAVAGAARLKTRFPEEVRIDEFAATILSYSGAQANGSK